MGGKAKATIKDIDKGYQRLVREVFGFGKPKLYVGITEATGGVAHDSGKGSVAFIAEIHEFGLGVPERSFIRAWFDANQDKIKRAIAASMQAVLELKITKQQALERLGAKFVAEIQRRISGGIPPALAESTVKRKGSSTPLIDTGQLRSSITYKVVIDK